MRSIVGVHDGGKSLQDVWHHNPASFDAEVGRDKTPLCAFVSNYDWDSPGSVPAISIVWSVAVPDTDTIPAPVSRQVSASTFGEPVVRISPGMFGA